MMIIDKKITHKFALIILAVLSCVILYSKNSYAQLTNNDLPNREGIKFGLGNAVVHAAYTQQEQYDSNIFLTPSDRRIDVITLLNPSAGIEIPMGDNLFSADYAAGINFFGHYTKQDHIDHKVRGLAEINLTDYKITVKDTFDHFTDRSGTENTARIKQQTNSFKAGISAEFELLGFDIGYRNEIQDYLSTEVFYGPLNYEDKSTMTHIIVIEGSYRFMPKTLFLVETDLGFVDYYNSSLSPDSYFIETVLGIKGEWFKKINVNFKAGLRYQSYEKSDSIIVGNKDYIGPVLRGGFDYSITEYDKLEVRLERAIYESTYNNMNYYDVNYIGCDYVHEFSDKLSVTAGLSYQLNLYPGESTENGVTAKRYDNLFDISLGGRYEIRKWLALEAKYEYRQRISRFSNLNYYDNLITIRGTVGF